MASFDPRITPVRADLAAKHLEGTVQAERFVEGRVRTVVVPLAPVRQQPSLDAPLDTEAIHGERVTVYDDNGKGWCWGQLDDDGYVGWLPSGALGDGADVPTHRVDALRTFVFPGPSIKLPPVDSLPFGSRVSIRSFDKDLAVGNSGGFLPARHLRPIGEAEKDYVAVVERFLGTPYLWGGKTALGIDCSGLVQVAMTAAGRKCPRDSDMQENVLGQRLEYRSDFSNLQRGDLLFWPGHVAIACGDGRLVHANAFHMAVAIEPVGDAVRRIGAAGVGLKSVRRILSGA